MESELLDRVQPKLETSRLRVLDRSDLRRRQTPSQLLLVVGAMPIHQAGKKSHQRYLEWTPTRIIERAGKVGPFTARLVEGIVTSKPHPEMGYSALGVIRLERTHGAERLEAASTERCG